MNIYLILYIYTYIFYNIQRIVILYIQRIVILFNFFGNEKLKCDSYVKKFKTQREIKIQEHRQLKHKT